MGGYSSSSSRPPDHHTTPKRGRKERRGDGLALPRWRLVGRRRAQPTPFHATVIRGGRERGRASKEEKRNGERDGAQTLVRLALTRLAAMRCLHWWARIRRSLEAAMIKNSWVRVLNPQHSNLPPQPIRTTNH